MKNLLIWLENGYIKTFTGSYSACLLRSNLCSPNECIIFSPEGEIELYRVKTLAFLNQIFIYCGGSYNDR